MSALPQYQVLIYRETDGSPPLETWLNDNISRYQRIASVMRTENGLRFILEARDDDE